MEQLLFILAKTFFAKHHILSHRASNVVLSSSVSTVYIACESSSHMVMLIVIHFHCPYQMARLFQVSYGSGMFLCVQSAQK